MLVLSRKTGEGIVITVDGKQVEIIMVESRTGRARLAVKADRDVKILRSELHVEETNDTQTNK